MRRLFVVLALVMLSTPAWAEPVHGHVYYESKPFQMVQPYYNHLRMNFSPCNSYNKI